MEHSGTKALGVMQPYFFPYLGYFQYLNACDSFILYDDVQFIMRGWINRNNILVNGAAHLFTVPLQKASPNRTISDTQVAWGGGWEERLLKTVIGAYGKAPQRSAVMDLLTEVLEKRPPSIAVLAARSIEAVHRYLGLSTVIIPTSSGYGNAGLDRQERLVDLCRRTASSTCIVPAGGSALYSKEEFKEAGLELRYLHAGLEPYDQRGKGAFVPSLSIIDVLMWNPPEAVVGMLGSYTLR
ncbi:MAG: WbqC family protein [Flavobacteriales bacterium]|nr:WbqC family protein [Flavobacteriales bacterium]